MVYVDTAPKSDDGEKRVYLHIFIYGNLKKKKKKSRKSGGFHQILPPWKTPRINFPGGFLEIFSGAEPPEKTPGPPENFPLRTPPDPPKLSLFTKGYFPGGS